MSIPFLLVPLYSAPYFRVSILGGLAFATAHTGLRGTFPHYIGTAGFEPATCILLRLTLIYVASLASLMLTLYH